MRALVTTTINVPTGLAKWRETLDYDGKREDMIFVVGDKKSPHEEIITFLASLPGGGATNVYLHPDEQKKWGSSEIIGWNCIQRRNIGFLEALTWKPSLMFTVDDDNVPLQTNYAEVCSDILRGVSYYEGRIISSDTGWYNVTKMLGVHHRGFPHSERFNDREVADFHYNDPSSVGVVASFWSGAPDIDAIERICCDPTIDAYMLPETPWYLAPKTWSPFNSQATAFQTWLIPSMLMLPGVGRFDDIWASYITRHVMDRFGMHAAHGAPNVHQDRNPHDNITDLKAEMFGYEYNERFIDDVQSVDISHVHSAKAATELIFKKLFNEARYLPEQTRESMLFWMTDLERVEKMTGWQF